MIARIIALSVLMAELCSTCPLLAASPVRLSLSNATDYATIVVVNTNLLKGIGLAERLILAPGHYTYSDNHAISTGNGMVPHKSYWFVHGFISPERIAEVAWPMSYSNETAFAVDDGFAQYGFVPSSFAPWTGGALSAATNAWLRNGYDAASDIRAVFSADSRLFPTNTLPRIPTFDGIPDFATMTNAYALLDSPYVQTALYVEGPVASLCAYSNELSVAIDYIDVTYQFTEYQIPGTNITDRYASGYTETPSSYTHTYRGTGSVFNWYATHEVEYYTPYDIEYTSAEQKGGKVHVLTPYKARDAYSTTLPDVSTPWRMYVWMRRGWDASGNYLYNTNLAIRAYAVLALKCTSSTTTSRRYAIPEVPTASTSSNLVRNVTVCLDLGELSIVEGETVDRGVPVVYEAATTPFDIAQTFRTAIAYAETNGAFDHGLFAQVPILDPAICDPADYPETTTKSTGGGGTATSVHEHAMQCVKIYFILLISPTYHARVLGQLGQ